MTTPSPADRIRAAAQLVRDLAKEATPGPWVAVAHDRTGHAADAWDRLPTWDDEPEEGDIEYVSLAMGTTLPAERNGALRMPGGGEPQHALIEYELGQIAPVQQAEAVASIRWIAALSPAVAEPLAAWLDTHAEWADEVQTMLADGLVDGPIDDRWPGLTAALALADALGVEGGT